MSTQYFASKISDNMAKTPEGYLICFNVPISKAGEFVYADGDIKNFTPKNGEFLVKRSNDVLSSPETIASFEGKPFTFKHPDVITVDSSNWSDYIKGVVQNVRAEGGFLIADVIVYDEEIGKLITSGAVREISCGSNATYEQIEDGVLNTVCMEGNHVSLLHAGRCGPQCAVIDGAPQPKELNMSLKDKITAAIDKVLGSEEENKQNDEAMDKPKEEVKDEAKEKVADADPMVIVAEKLDMIVKMLESMSKKEPEASVIDSKDSEETKEKALDTAEEYKKTSVALDGAIEADSQTLALSEIIAPSVISSGSRDKVMQMALDHAYSQKQGRNIIDELLAGRPFDDEAKKDKTLFVATAKVIGAQRNSQMSHMALDQKVDYSNMTPERLSKIYEQHFKGAR